MTSSLVGSEMCIRDSQRQDQAITTLDPLRAWTNANHIRTHARQRGINAVSYTHLTLPTICSV
eukprot:2265823-Prorocentrum_lima.AAC.1